MAPTSVYALLHRERDRLFPDEMFADLFSAQGRRSVPPSVVATVMVLQRLEGLSDREAVERYSFDARWRYAAGVGGYNGGGWGRFAHTVLVDMRARLDRSEDPKRIFRVSKEAAAGAGLVGARRVLDSTPLYDAVATMDTITLIRSAIRGLLRVAEARLEAELRSVLRSGDDYASNAKPQIAWDDPEAREGLIDSRARDAFACLAVLDGRELGVEVAEAAQLLAKVVGQDLEGTDDGRFRIARRVAKDRVISTVDPEARHGHKTAARGFDGYKGHVGIDPDSEIITDTVVTPGNAGMPASPPSSSTTWSTTGPRATGSTTTGRRPRRRWPRTERKPLRPRRPTAAVEAAARATTAGGGGPTRTGPRRLSAPGEPRPERRLGGPSSSADASKPTNPSKPASTRQPIGPPSTATPPTAPAGSCTISSPTASTRAARPNRPPPPAGRVVGFFDRCIPRISRRSPTVLCDPP